MGCFLCDAAARGVGEDTLVLHLTGHSMVILNRYPYISGHLMVTPIAHVKDLSELSDEQERDLHRTLVWATARVRDVLKPHGVNLGMNLGKAAGAGVEDHIHYHIVPRFAGDNNAMNVLGDVRVIPESLEATFRRYLPAFSE
jgi:ATP adenylyltransferase